MKIASVSLFAAGIASTGVVAAPAPMEMPSTSPNLAKRGLWFRDEWFPESGGNTIGGSTLWMLRNTWNNRFGGDFGGSLGVRLPLYPWKVDLTRPVRYMITKACVSGDSVYSCRPRGKVEGGLAMRGATLCQGFRAWLETVNRVSVGPGLTMMPI